MCKGYMGCNFVLALLVIIFAFWQTVASKWILLAVGILMLLSALSCPGCKSCDAKSMPKQKAKPKRKKK